MDNIDFLFAVISAVVLFLYGLSSFSQELQEIGRDRLTSVLGRMTNSRLSGFFLGAGFTANVQSSSAVTSLAVALVDSGVISFASSLSVLVGANVGTTATAWLVSFKLTGIGPVFIVLGAVISMLPAPIKVAGKAIFYFGFIFFALDLIGDSLAPLKQADALPGLLSYASNALLGGLIGAALTALLQSSSVVTGLAILLVQQGTLDIQAAVAIIIGANLGSSVTALIASIPMSAPAKRLAQVNVLLNLGGVVLFLPFSHLLAELVISITDDPGIAVALAHLIFNVGVALIALPMLNWLAVRLAPNQTG